MAGVDTHAIIDTNFSDMDLATLEPLFLRYHQLLQDRRWKLRQHEIYINFD